MAGQYPQLTLGAGSQHEIRLALEATPLDGHDVDAQLIAYAARTSLDCHGYAFFDASTASSMVPTM